LLAVGVGFAADSVVGVHVSKNLEDGLFPSLRERDGTSEDAALEEERRLAYVAITRARSRLVLTHARTRMQWGKIQIQTPSRFLDDLPPDCLATSLRASQPQIPRGPRIVDGNFAPRRSKFGRGSAYGSGGRRSDDEFDQRVEPDEPVYSVEDAAGSAPTRGPFSIGAAVSHVLFGAGRVVAVTGAGQDQKATVEFANVGRKTVFVHYLHPSNDAVN